MSLKTRLTALERARPELRCCPLADQVTWVTVHPDKDGKLSADDQARIDAAEREVRARCICNQPHVAVVHVPPEHTP
jgi:hypothetical protein